MSAGRRTANTKKAGPILAFFMVSLMVVFGAGARPAAENALVLQATETQVTTAAADQYDPSISANLVAYIDFSGVDADVWYTDLTSGQAFPVARGAGDQQLIGVSGGRIVYTDWNTMDVMVFDVATRQTTNLTNAGGSNSLDPAIDGTLVAWTDDRDGNAEIYARDLATGDQRRITNDLLVDQSPAIRNGLIVWERCNIYNCDVFAYDWAAGTTRQLTSTEYASERFPDAYGRTVVFQREQGTPIDKDLVAIDLDTGVERVLALPGDQENPHISGQYVSFNDSASGVPHIGLWDLASGTHFEVTSGAGGQYLNDIDGNRIVYTDDRNGSGNLDIYMCEFRILSSPPTDVPPEQQIEGIVQFFDSSVASGALLGNGPGKSASNRVNALRNMLKAAGDLIRKGDTAGAYQQLSDAYLKTDGQPQPPDFVTGTAAGELARMIRSLMASL